MKLRAQNGASEGHWLRAEKQSGGKGRLGRKWESPEGNLYCSTLVELSPGDPAPPSLSFVTALAVYQVIQHYLPGAGIMLKWPNDILVSDAKICGILLERAGDFVVAGIGVNIAVLPEVDGRNVTSLHHEGADISVMPSEFLDRLAESFAKKLNDWRRSGLPILLEQWQQLAHSVGTELSVSTETGDQITGEFDGLSQDGALRLRKLDGTLIEIRAGDVSLER